MRAGPLDRGDFPFVLVFSAVVDNSLHVKSL